MFKTSVFDPVFSSGPLELPFFCIFILPSFNPPGKTTRPSKGLPNKWIGKMVPLRKPLRASNTTQLGGWVVSEQIWWDFVGSQLSNSEEKWTMNQRCFFFETQQKSIKELNLSFLCKRNRYVWNERCFLKTKGFRLKVWRSTYQNQWWANYPMWPDWKKRSNIVQCSASDW